MTVALDTDGADAARPFVEAATPEHPTLLDAAHVTDELFGFVNVPNGVWIDEEGTLVRPAEPAHPGPSPLRESIASLDLSSLPPLLADVLAETRRIRTAPEEYVAALRDWVEHGAGSRFALPPDEVVRRSQPRPSGVAEAAAHFELGQHLHRTGHPDAAVGHFREAHRLQPDNWTYRRQAWHFVAPGLQGPNDVYEGNWLSDIREIGAENYYPPFVP